MGPFSQRWAALGPMQQVFGIAETRATIQNACRVLGPMHSIAYAFLNHEGSVDWYVRSATTMPLSRFNQYKLV